MAGNAVAAVKALDGVVGDPDLDLLLDQGVRHRVVVPPDVHVVVDMYPGLLPFGIDITLCRQRLQGRLVQLLEVIAPTTGQLPERAVVELLQQFTDAGFELPKREVLTVAQCRQYPPLNDQHATLHLGLVPGFSGSCGDNGHTVWAAMS